ncbi:MAG TPA: copper ion binding protein, partial [Chloroflexota bacterium]|nr:copper ion binding protein [Chloroflexota bacterium]
MVTTPVVDTISFGVTGMTCASCVRRVEKALAKTAGIQEASVNLATEKATVTYDPTQASQQQIQAAVEKAGYGVRDLPEQSAPRVTTELALPIEGMTCASCVRRVERSLTKVPGVQDASVNLATELARVSFDPSVVGLPQLKEAVAKAGYQVGEITATTTPAQDLAGVQPLPGEETLDRYESERRRELDDLKHKAFVSLGVGLAMMLLMYLPLGIDMLLLAPALLIAATLVQFWAGRGFYEAAWAAARHGSTNMNTLVAVGTSVAYGYSAFVTLWPSLASRWGFPYHLYYETAVTIIALILMGRWLEAR